MKRWDVLVLVAGVLVTVAAAGVDWRLGCAVASGVLVAVWYWLGETET